MQRSDRWTIEPNEATPLEDAVDDRLAEILIVQDAAPGYPSPMPAYAVSGMIPGPPLAH